MILFLSPAIALAAQLPEPGPNLTTVLVTMFTTLATIFTAYFGVRQMARAHARRMSGRSGPPSDPQELDVTEHDGPSRLHPPPSDLQDCDGFEPETHPDRPSRYRDDGRYDSNPRAAKKPPKPPRPTHRKTRP